MSCNTIFWLLLCLRSHNCCSQPCITNPNGSDCCLPGACSKQGEGTWSRSANAGVEVATPSSTQPTVSTLTTEGGGGGGQEREDGVGEEGREEGEQLPSLKSVFDCPYIKIKTVNDGKDRWECGWCGKICAPRHASRALWHVLKIKRGDIAVCKVSVLDKFQTRYQALYDSGRG
jgi:hypothetical protein